jgi:quinol monooxygenase YgiN
MIEKWATPADADAHRYGDTVKKLGAAFEGKLAAPLDVHRLIPHPAGDPELGVI